MMFRAAALTALLLATPWSPALAEVATPEIKIDIDLSSTEDRAKRARELLQTLRERRDLARFEFTKRVRIAPNEIPHSHPILTINTFAIENENKFLSTYLHEQVHWYLHDHRRPQLAKAIALLKKRYPEVPSPKSERARDEYSIYLHLVVNWLEIDAMSQVIGRDPALRVFERPVAYRWIYRTVIKDWDLIGSVLRDTGVAPMPDARKVSLR